MSRSTALILLGVLTILAPLSGLPASWITFLLAIFGIIIVILGIALRAEGVRRMQASSPVAPAPAPAPESEPVIEHHKPSSIA